MNQGKLLAKCTHKKKKKITLKRKTRKARRK